MLNMRQIEVFRPYDNEFPESLLLAQDATEACLESWLQSEILRVGKLGTQVLGCYAMNRLSELEFNLLGVAVEQQVRKQGLGRWLVGHAIGVAESKGGRRVLLAQTGSSRCFSHIGFVRAASGWLLELIQE